MDLFIQKENKNQNEKSIQKLLYPLILCYPLGGGGL